MELARFRRRTSFASRKPHRVDEVFHSCWIYLKLGLKSKQPTCTPPGASPDVFHAQMFELRVLHSFSSIPGLPDMTAKDVQRLEEVLNKNAAHKHARGKNMVVRQL